MPDADTSHVNGEPMTEGRRLRRIELTVRPEESFQVPYSDGYSVYSSLLDLLATVDADLSDQVHDRQLGGVHSSGLLGRFASADRPHHKMLRSAETYELTLGVVDPADADIFQALVSGLVLDGDTLELSHGTLRVETFESNNTSHKELLDRAASTDASGVEVRFRTPTCIQEVDDVTTMFPHRWVVFRSLVGKWNMTSLGELKLDLDRETILEEVIEKPDAGTYATHSVLVNRVTNDDGENRNIFRQGFTGTCKYAFKGASESMRNAVVALALFGEYSGVGSAVARGCGKVGVELEQ